MLTLYHYENPQSGTGWTVQRLREDWDEDTVTYDTMPAYDTYVYDTAYLDGIDSYIYWNITDLVAEWFYGYYPNHGLLITNDYQIMDDWPSLASSDHAEADWRPKLVIDYHPTGSAVEEASWGAVKARTE